MKKTHVILLTLLVLIFSVSCEKECEDEMRYNGMAKTLAQIDKDIDETQQLLLGVDMEEDLDFFLQLQDELTMLMIDKALIEIEMEVLKRDSRCF